jgi:RimJ/RimL family protein N-acetyltransferase
MRYKRMTGEKVYLTALISEDAETVTRWLNDPEVTQYLSEHREIKSLELVKEDMEEHIKTGAAFAVFDRDSDTMIGTCVLDGDGIMILMGEKEYWSKGCDTEAISFLLDFGFNLRNCGNISVSAYSHDTRSLALFEEIGFTKTVVQRERLIRGRDKYDLIFFDMLASEYFKREKTDA